MRASKTPTYQINNPLQSLTNIVYLASEDRYPVDVKTLALKLAGQVQELSALAAELPVLRNTADQAR